MTKSEAIICLLCTIVACLLAYLYELLYWKGVFIGIVLLAIPPTLISISDKWED